MHFSRLDWESGYSKAGEDIVAPQENVYVTATKRAMCTILANVGEMALVWLFGVSMSPLYIKCKSNTFAHLASTCAICAVAFLMPAVCRVEWMIALMTLGFSWVCTEGAKCCHWVAR